MLQPPKRFANSTPLRVHIKRTINWLLFKDSLNSALLSWSLSSCIFSSLRFSLVRSSVMVVAASFPVVVLYDSGSTLMTTLIITGISSMVSGRVLGCFFCCVLLVSMACLFLVKFVKTVFDSLVSVVEFFCGGVSTFVMEVAFFLHGVVFFYWAAFFVCLGIVILALRLTLTPSRGCRTDLVRLTAHALFYSY